MTPEQIKSVQQSFAQVAAIAEPAAGMFYDRLFAIAPEVKPLFPADMAQQRAKLMATLTFVVNRLDNLESILPAASALAKRHVGYGVKAEHYELVGEALIWTLQQGLGSQWSSALAAAWSATYAALAKFMIGEAYGQAQAAE
jgi:hemoglobin-like flavoprotein